ncbi:MAG: hypothetical protein OSJ73_00590 [Lachnospiraceae bacterium]|jgi:hypothetical protein|nr:hypothetical protein [Lachnospiraceae bacterium]
MEEKDAYYYYIKANEYYNNGKIEEAIPLLLRTDFLRAQRL